ncbi:MAG: hypothetical protein IKY22_06865 [Bacteroidales bacterium]|nr:hypothetical protein [Bacteroidales bacterium]
MTSQEREEYEKLSKTAREYYDMYMRNHPGASHVNAYKLAVRLGKTEKIFDENNGNIDLGRPEIQKGILEETAEFISRMAPRVWAQVRSDFQRAIDYLGDLVRRGMNWVEENIVDPIIDFLDDIFG